MKIPLLALPLLGAAGGLLLGAVVGLLAALLFRLTGITTARALDIGLWFATSGFAAGAIVGTFRIIERWLSEPPDSVARDHRRGKA
jgi:hypothetical protein